MAGLINALAMIGINFYIILCPVFVLSLIYSIQCAVKDKKADDPGERWFPYGAVIVCWVSLILLMSPVIAHCAGTW